MKRLEKTLLLLGLLLLFPLRGLEAAPERVSFLPPLLGQSTRTEEEALRKALADAAALTAALHGDSLAVVPDGPGGEAEYRLKTVAVLDGADSTVVLSLRRAADGEERGPQSLLGPVGRDTGEYVAQALFSLWSAFHGYLADAMEDPPVLLDELSMDVLPQSLLAGRGVSLTPMSLAVRGDGHLVAGMISLAVEFDRNLRVVGQPGRSLLEEGNYAYAYGVAVTPADTLYCKPSMGRELYRFPDGVTEAQRVRLTGVDAQSPFAVLADGSMVFLDMQKRRAVRISGKTQTELNLFRSPYSWIGSIAAGPEGTLWAYDIVERRIRVYTADGKQVSSILPVVDPADPLNPYSLAVRADGSFLFSCTGGELRCFRSNGAPWWRMRELDEAGREPLPQTAAVAADSASGLLYLSDYPGKRILRLLDLSFCRQYGIAHTAEDGILEQNAVLAEDPENPEPWGRKAALYETAGALEMARGAWQECLRLSPDHPEAQVRLRALEAASLRIQADELSRKTLGILDSLGPESARASFSQALQLYERVLRAAPDDAAARARMEELQRRMGQGGGQRPAGPRPLTIVEARLEPLFPALLRYYAEHPAGSLTVENATGEEAKDVKATLFIQKFMDFPAETEGRASLKPGEKTTLPVRVLLNEGVLDVQEDLSVQARIVLTWRSGGEERTASRTVNTVLYRRTALSWDFSGKLASFITPNEESISSFSLKMSAPSEAIAQWRFSDRFLRAQSICGALGAYGIAYVEDPESPLSRTLGKPQAIDTVRFPRTTLLSRAGDCDDTTALLASLLEAAGVRTAILTTPGHVFLAFDSGEPEENAAYLSSPALETLRRDGTLWIPVETTVLGKGFAAAWKAASELVRRHAPAGTLEFLPTLAQWETYPPLPLSRSTMPIIEPQRGAVDALAGVSARDLTAALYGSRIAEMRKLRSESKGRQALRIMTQEGVLHALFGHAAEAAQAFRACLAEDPGYASAYANLANLRLTEDDVDGAIGILEEGLARNGDSAVLWLLRARCAQAKGDTRKTTDSYRMLALKSPEMGARYASEFPGAASGAADGAQGLAAAPTTGAQTGVASGATARASGGSLKDKAFWADSE